MARVLRARRSIASTQYSATDCALPPGMFDTMIPRAGRRLQRHEVDPGAVDRHGAHARRGVEDVVGQLAARDDAVAVRGERARGLGGAVGRAHDLGLAGEHLFAGGRDRVDDEDPRHSGSQEKTSCERSSG
jgi:hypothetical protein